MNTSYQILLLLLMMALSASGQVNTDEFYNVDGNFHNVDQEGLAVSGYDLIEYFVSNKPAKGSPAFEYTYEGVKYHFLSEENKTTFSKNPQKYLPQFGGYCAYGLAMDSGINGNPPGKYPVDPQTFKIIDGKLYLFWNSGGLNALPYWERAEDTHLKKAKERWAEIHKNK